MGNVKARIGKRHGNTECHEVENCLYESDLHEKKKLCKKNPGHLDFIPALSFTLDHLPDGYRDRLVLDFIETVIFLTVRIVVSYTSNDRPDDYGSSNLRGSYRMRFGSGVVMDMLRKFTKHDGKRCPCKECKEFPEEAKTHWGAFSVFTALHVVYNNEECSHASCDVGFNRDEDRDICNKLEGVEICGSNIEYDDCKMCCVTHDESLCNKLEDTIQRYRDLRDQVYEKYSGPEYDELSKNPAVFCVSHPHGMSKHVSLGVLKSVEKVPPYAWNYSTHTCPGTSGAMVFMLRLKESWLYGYNFIHSKAIYGGDNQCTFHGW